MAFNDFLRKHTIKFNISLILGILSVLLIVLLVLYSVLKLRDEEISSAQQNAIAFTSSFSGEIKSELDVSVITAENFAETFESVKDPNAQAKLSRDQSNAMLKQTLVSRKTLLGVWTCWEPSPSGFDYYDSSYAGFEGHDSTGRYIPYFTRDEQGNISLTPLTGYDLPEATWYNVPKETQKSSLFTMKYEGHLIFSTSVPIVYNSKFYGVAGVDIDLNFLQKLIDKTTKNNFNGKATFTIITNEDKIAAQSGNKSLQDMPIKGHLNNIDKLKEGLNKNDFFVMNDTLYAFAPLILGKDKANWQVLMRIPTKVITMEATWQLIIFTFLGIIFIFIQLIVGRLIVNKLISPITSITLAAENLSVGDSKILELEVTSLEIGKLGSAFEKLATSQKNITDVCVSISQGDFTKQAVVKSEYDDLSKAVNKMIDNLKTAAIEDAKRNWTTEGIAKFADLLRLNIPLKELTYEVISELIKYIGANQGGIFLVEEEPELHLELSACYAYDRRKYITKKVGVGEGLVGQCILEGSTIYITEVPQNYIQITSGVGHARPNCVLIVPLKVNDKIEGVIEIASFKKFEKHEIAFIEKVAESTTATLSNSKINQKTSILLASSKEQAEIMRAQEEEMRQNLEEMLATQEEASRKEIHYEETIERLQHEVMELKNKLQNS